MEAEYENLYRMFPRSGGSDYWRQQCRQQLRTAEDIANCRLAIEAYVKVKKGTDMQYVKTFSTFMGEWRSWLVKATALPKERDDKPKPFGANRMEIDHPIQANAKELAEKYLPEVRKLLATAFPKLPYDPRVRKAE